MKMLRSPLLVLSLVACGGPAVVPAAPAVQKLVLAADPGEAVGVVDAKLAGPKDRAVVIGRIGVKHTPGLAMFTLVDLELPYCGEKNPEDKCQKPWDYCCESQKTITANAMVVEARGADGKPFATPSLPDLRLADKVKVTGRLEKDGDGNFVLVATGFFRVERPALPDYVEWPQ